METDRVGHLAARLTTLGPAATLARGYAVVQTVDGPASILRSTADAAEGTLCGSELPTARSAP